MAQYLVTVNVSVVPANGSGTCAACERPVRYAVSKSGKLHSAPVVCEACRKFYCRNLKNSDSLICTCGPNLEPAADCRFCRFERCQQALRTGSSEKRSTNIRSIHSVSLSSSSSSPTDQGCGCDRPQVDGSVPGICEAGVGHKSRLDFRKIPCKVCGVSSSGIHFGVVSCEGCKGFFRRSMRGTYRLQYRCKQQPKSASPGKEPETLCDQSSNCRLCRLKRCQDAGMSLSESAIGRLNRQQRRELDETIAKLSMEHAALTEPVLRRTKRGTSESDPVTGSSADQQCQSTSSSGNSSGSDDHSPTVVKLEPNLAPLESSSGASSDEDFHLTAQIPIEVDLPPDMPPTCGTASLEMSLAPSVDLTRPIALYDPAAMEWLVGRAAEATARLAPISNTRIIIDTSDGPSDSLKMELLGERSRAFDVYIKSISDFVTNLPGMSHFSIQDRVVLFSNAFFPILVGQLSLQFDCQRQRPNHFSLDRDGAWQMVCSCNSWHHLVERFLCVAGNRLTSAVYNLQEYALVCALLCFNPDIPNLTDRGRLLAVRDGYEAALAHMIQGFDKSRLEQLREAVEFFRSSTNVFHCEIRGLPTHCAMFLQVASPLFKDFRLQFIETTPAVPCTGYLA